MVYQKYLIVDCMVTLNMVTIFILFLVIVKECFKLINFSKQYIILGMLSC